MHGGRWPAVIIGGPTLRLRSDYLAIVTLGFGEIVRISARNLSITGSASGISGIEQPWLFGWHIATPTDFYYVFCVLAIIAVIVSVRLANSRLGRAWLYVRHDEDVAEAMGIDRVRVKLAAYVIGAIFAAVGGRVLCRQSRRDLAGELLVHAIGAHPDGRHPGRHGQDPRRRFSVPSSSFWGPNCCAASANLRLLVFAVGLLLIMLFRPSGIWPGRSTQK